MRGIDRSRLRSLLEAAPPAAAYVGNATQAVLENTAFRRVLFTGPQTQLVAMSLPPAEAIGQETHAHVEQTFLVVAGRGVAVLNGQETPLGVGSAVVVPPRVTHDIRNTGLTPLALLTSYSPPNHPDGTVHMTRADADADRRDATFGARVRRR